MLVSHPLNIVLFYLFIISVPLSCNSQKNISIFNKKTEEISVDKGQVFGIELATHPGTGYVWKIKEVIDSNLLKIIKEEYKELGDEQLDFPGLDYFEFKALKKGNTTILLWYIRPWKKNNKINPDIKVKTFNIKIN